MKYKIIIEEHVSDVFEVEAKSAEEALEIAKQKYNECKFVLEPGTVTHKCMAVCEPEETEWVEL